MTSCNEVPCEQVHPCNADNIKMLLHSSSFNNEFKAGNRSLIMYTTSCTKKAVEENQLCLISIIGNYKLDPECNVDKCYTYLDQDDTKKFIKCKYGEYNFVIGRDPIEKDLINFKKYSSHIECKINVMKSLVDNMLVVVTEVREYLIEGYGVLHVVYTYEFNAPSCG